MDTKIEAPKAKPAVDHAKAVHDAATKLADAIRAARADGYAVAGFQDESRIERIAVSETKKVK